MTDRQAREDLPVILERRTPCIAALSTKVAWVTEAGAFRRACGTPNAQSERKHHRAIMNVELNINGILTCPGKSEGWTDRAVTHAHLDMDVFAEKLENFTGIFTRMLFQEKRARFVARIANKYLERGWNVYLRGHSNGCDIIRRALSHTASPIEAAQLVAPAVEPDFERNGFNRLLREGKVKRLMVCWSPNDRTLRLARHSHAVLNILGNAYGILGLIGPQNVAPDVESRVTAVANVQYDHGDWLAKENLLATMELLHAPASSWAWRQVA